MESWTLYDTVDFWKQKNLKWKYTYLKDVIELWQVVFLWKGDTSSMII